jgi:cellulose synthase (UDP-forming)
LLISTFFVQVLSTMLVILRRRGRFVVTPKHGVDGPQPGSVFPALLAMGFLLAAMAYALDQSLTAATLNNVAFALLHLSVLLVGSWSALVGRRRSIEPPVPETVAPVRAELEKVPA